MDFKLIGSILLIVGTAIGAGMLALPIATAQAGFMGSLILLLAVWFIMTVGAFYILEVNLWLPQNSNLISMAKATIGPVGQLIAWVTYLLLLYSLLCAYISGGSDLFQNLLHARGITLHRWLASVVFTVLFGGVVYLGIRSVDYVNRVLMFVKLGAFALLIAFLLPVVSAEHLAAGNMQQLFTTTAIMVTVTSFGYAGIVPSLRIYFAGDVKKLKTAILIGSLIPLICYLFWDMAIMGIIPLSGNGLMDILHADNSTSTLVNTLSTTVGQNTVTFLTKLFTSICVITSFLGVALCLTDFLADGFQLEKTGSSHLLIIIMTFLPPIAIVLLSPNIFVSALSYAGIYCVVLLILLPSWMVWHGRYHRCIASGFRVPGGKALVMSTIVISLALLAMGFLL